MDQQVRPRPGICVKIELIRTVQFKLRIEVLSSSVALRTESIQRALHQPRGPSSNKEEQLNEINGEQGAPEGRM